MPFFPEALPAVQPDSPAGNSGVKFKQRVESGISSRQTTTCAANPSC